MRKSITCGLTLWAALTAFGGEAKAHLNYPWCYSDELGIKTCAFSTRDQCFDIRNPGRGSHCARNPAYDPKKGRVVEEPRGAPPASNLRGREH
jgi:hypothetical protein